MLLAFWCPASNDVLIVMKWKMGEDVMYTRLTKCIRWPDKETKTLPIAFQKHFPQARCIIDHSVQLLRGQLHSKQGLRHIPTTRNTIRQSSLLVCQQALYRYAGVAGCQTRN